MWKRISNIKRTFAIGFLLLSLLTISSTVSVKGELTYSSNGGKTIVTTDDITIEITGNSNVPKFSFWENNNEETVYRIQMSQLFEFNDTNLNGVYDQDSDKKIPATTQSLAPFSWNFSNFEEGESNGVDTLDFLLSTLSSPDELFLGFPIHLRSDNSASLKFDVLIENYEFHDTSALLALVFTLEAEEDGIQNGNTIDFGDGFFETQPTAQAGGEEINVGLSSSSDEASDKLFLAYEHFSGNLAHDPIMGIKVQDVENSEIITPTDTTSGNTAVSNNEPIIIDTVNNILSELRELVTTDASMSNEEQFNSSSRIELFVSTVLATFVFITVPLLITRLKKIN